ncbi:hypothetical protein [Celerinatantimonas diazotrophica]|uniref:Uncharacterized protein n=1 Tax=Celerinatantimonas diazotrophica TaxID=412034 RepID=A0A4R1K476_9GAMM|nr:hypothetical protein [Celerinatantimonas diazotrophica]TCK58926.1 hypothetical protein EV690_1084 [Celerinatantimonas diazotrophica]CAG9297559.1 hypothetical protein CEDIAZO_02747 [Celerinatantimonas diazotrophica]
MLSKKHLLVTVALIFFPMISVASQFPLVNSCVELVNIYKSRNEQHLLAAQTTSLSQSLRAGYCLGVLTQYAESHSCYSNWFKRAEYIANYASEDFPPSEKKLLELSCEN